MKPFKNETLAGNEKAIKFGPSVPEGGINLSYVKTQKLSPKSNIVIVDTSRISDPISNVGNVAAKKILYANELGVLLDEDNNIAFPSEYPVIGDQFLVDEDWSVVPGSEYASDDFLPYVHVSRYFHLEHVGLVAPGEVRLFKHDLIRVVDSRGIEYLDKEGRPRYRTKIVGAFLNSDIEVLGSLWAYRVLVYVDDDSNEDLYLTYNKVEIQDSDGALVRRVPGYKESLNPEPYFQYNPEESDVVDPRNRNKLHFSTKPVLEGRAGQVAALSGTSDGYKIFVPRKAIGDPRLYQLFRWRIRCTFDSDLDVDISRDVKRINCGILVTTTDLQRQFPSRAPYALLNLQRSRFNLRDVELVNPLMENHSSNEKEVANYWYVNIDTADLSQFDFLIWAPTMPNFDMGPYSAKIDSFVRTNRGTLFFDTNNTVDTGSSLTGQTSAPVDPIGRGVKAGFESHTYPEAVESTSPSWGITSHPLIDGASELGGWDLRETENNNELLSMSYTQLIPLPETGTRYCQRFAVTPYGYDEIIICDNADDPEQESAVTIALEYEGGGNKILSTFGQTQLCSMLVDNNTNRVLSNNWDYYAKISAEYDNDISSPGVEGAMKFLYNAALLSVRGRALSEEDEDFFSTRWSHTTPWQSSWVINGVGDGVLDERERERYNFLVQERDVYGATPDGTFVWKRRLSPFTVDELVERSLKVLKENPVFASRIKGATRSYHIEVTNPNVMLNTVTLSNEFPVAWTEVYSPKFEVPANFGPHAIREEIDSSGIVGRRASLDKVAKFSHVSYPPKPYDGRVAVSYLDSEEKTVQHTGPYTATADIKVEIKGYYQENSAPAAPPPSGGGAVSTSTVWTWWKAWGNTPESAFRQLKVNTSFPNFGERLPNGITTYQQLQYYGNGRGQSSRCYPYWGFSGSVGRLPALDYYGRPEEVRPDHVRFLQDALKRFSRLNYFPGSDDLPVTGVFDGRTEFILKKFQETFNAHKQDGVADAETWFIIGSQIERARHEGKLNSVGDPPGPVSESDFTKHYLWSSKLARWLLSDGQNTTYFAKRSDSRDGPPRIWDIIFITYPTVFRTLTWKSVRVVPFLMGDTKTMTIDFIDVRNVIPATSGSERLDWVDDAKLPHINRIVRDNVPTDFTLPPNTKGNVIIVGVSQSGLAGGHWGAKGRMFGFREISTLTMDPAPASAPLGMGPQSLIYGPHPFGSNISYSQSNAAHYQAPGSTGSSYPSLPTGTGKQDISYPPRPLPLPLPGLVVHCHSVICLHSLFQHSCPSQWWKIGPSQ